MRTIDRTQKGSSYIELMIVITIIGILAGFFLVSFNSNSAKGKETQEKIEKCLRERRSAAMRLMQANAEGINNLPPVTVNFADPATTAVLKIDGIDQDRDGVDDNSGEPLTHFSPSKNEWVYRYEGRPLELATNWELITSESGLKSFSPIPNSQLATSVSFDEEGRPIINRDSRRRTEKELFLAVYYRDKRDAELVIAVAIHGSGLIENWSYDFTTKSWKGYGGREL